MLPQFDGRTKLGTLLKHLIPLRTDHWQEKMPGFAEVDLVSHSGSSASGEFAYSLNLTDMHTGWTETRAILGKGRQAVLDALEEIQAALPFRCGGINSTTARNLSTGTWASGAPATRCSSAIAAPTRRTTTPTSSRRTGPMSAS